MVAREKGGRTWRDGNDSAGARGNGKEDDERRGMVVVRLWWMARVSLCGGFEFW